MIFKANFRIANSDVKIPANNHFNMVPDKIKGVSPTATRFTFSPVVNKIQTGLCIVYWKNVTYRVKTCVSENPSVIHSDSKWIPPAKKHHVDA